MVAELGVTSTLATGGGVTETVALPLLPSLVAVIVADPAATPCTSPLASTVAVPGAPLCHVIVRPESGFPLGSFGVAVSCTFPPIGMLGEAGVTETDATGMTVALTVMADVPLLPSLVAVMLTGPPTALPVTSPLALTVAMFVSALAHVTARPVSGLPLASFGVAVSCTVAFTAIVAVAGVTSTEATGTGITVIAAVPVLPSLVAVRVTGPPAALPVTRPLASTVARVASLVVHVTMRPVRGLPSASFGLAVSWSVAPT